MFRLYGADQAARCTKWRWMEICWHPRPALHDTGSSLLQPQHRSKKPLQWELSYPCSVTPTVETLAIVCKASVNDGCHNHIWFHSSQCTESNDVIDYSMLILRPSKGHMTAPIIWQLSTHSHDLFILTYSSSRLALWCLQVPIREVEGVLYLRISCQIYNQLSDYEALRDAVLKTCDRRDELVDHTLKFRQLL